METISVHFDSDWPLGDFSVIPPELLEKIMSSMHPLSLVPFMMSCSMMNALAHNDQIWDDVYKEMMPQSHKALHLAPSPEIWKFRNSSSIKFLYEFTLFQEMHPKSNLNEVYLVMQVMKDYRASVLVQRAAVYILRRLAYYPQDCDKAYRSQIEVQRATIGREGGIEALLRVVVNFREPDVISGALCAIGNLVIDVKNAEAVVDQDGIKSIIGALCRHPDNFSVLDYGSFALCNLGDGLKFKQAIYEANGFQVVLNALAENRFKLEQLTPSLDLLSVLCNVPEFKREHGRKIIELIDTLLPLCVENSILFAHLLQIAVLICENLDEIRDFAVGRSFIEKIFRALDIHSANAQIMVRCSLLLFTLFWRNESSGMTAHRSRLVRCIISAMVKFTVETSLQRTCAAMLSDFARSDPALKSLIVSLEGKKLVRAVLAHNEEDDPEWTALVAHISLDDY
jgi:hypothetical protein